MGEPVPCQAGRVIQHADRLAWSEPCPHLATELLIIEPDAELPAWPATLSLCLTHLRLMADDALLDGVRLLHEEGPGD